jgi:tRNA nucleotidyltransferase (CCA-adding enzyme)
MKSLEVLQKIALENDLEVYFAGGYVRDLLRKKKPKDVDLLIRGTPLEDLIVLLAAHGRVMEVGAHFGIVLFRAFNDREYVEIAIPRKARKFDKRNTIIDYDVYGKLREDANHRDFTINSMFMPINGKRKDIVDFNGGRADIKKRRIRAVKNSNARISEDPVRMLRAFSLSARLNYSIEDAFLKAIKRNAKLINSVAVERVRDELAEILLSKKPSKYLRVMEDVGLLRHILPFVSENVGTAQDRRYHKYDVFTHLLKACDSAPPDLVMRTAALLHDVGKYHTQDKHGKRISFHNHEVVSEIMARNMLTELAFPKDFVGQVTSLIRKHMYNYSREWSNRAVRKFIRDVGIRREDLDSLESIPLFRLREYDRLGNGFKKNARTEKQKDFEKRIKKLYKESSALTVHDLAIKGHDLMEKFDLHPGPIIGKTLRHLLNLVLENPQLNNKEKLLDQASIYLKVDKNGE